jgi:hypothetical protein
MSEPDQAGPTDNPATEKTENRRNVGTPEDDVLVTAERATGIKVRSAIRPSPADPWVPIERAYRWWVVDDPSRTVEDDSVKHGEPTVEAVGAEVDGPGGGVGRGELGANQRIECEGAARGLMQQSG